MKPRLWRVATLALFRFALAGLTAFAAGNAYINRFAYRQAVEDAKLSVSLDEDNYAREKNDLAAMRENAVPIGLTGSAHGYNWTVSEMSYANEKLYFTAAFSGIQTKNPNIAGMEVWLNNPSVDGMWTGPEVVGSESFKERRPHLGLYGVRYATARGCTKPERTGIDHQPVQKAGILLPERQGTGKLLLLLR